SLGVDRFFFVDNDSNDGTTEYLQEQCDVHIYWTDQSYARARSGIQWVNHLVEEHGVDNWCLYVDVDEALVFPHSEKCGLRKLLKYMDDKGQEALYGFMLNMYAPDLASVPRGDQYMDFLMDYPLFDSQYFQTKDTYCPYVFTSGGIQHLYDSIAPQTKTPIIKGGRGIKFLRSSHEISPASLSDVTCVLLHFKFAGDFKQCFAQEASVEGRLPYCKRRHMDYLIALENFSSGESLGSDVSVAYQSSQQLVELELIKTTDDFDAMNFE
ncbi:MAG: glycosyltransferase family 2 protein, partial [Crocinitomicaceae bacterium]|nr:glycosyltransferase family 2 protein [Crocinitomicaceae bacterium]